MYTYIYIERKRAAEKKNILKIHGCESAHSAPCVPATNLQLIQRTNTLPLRRNSSDTLQTHPTRLLQQERRRHRQTSPTFELCDISPKRQIGFSSVRQKKTFY